MLVPPESSSAELMMRGKSLSICNRSLPRLDNSSRTACFEGGTQIWCICTQDSLNLGGQTLHRWNLRWMPNISYAGIVLVYLEWFRRNSLLKCVLQPKIAKNSLKPSILGVQGRSRSSMLVPLESTSAVFVMISSKSASIRNCFHAGWANSGKKRFLRSGEEGTLFDALVRGESPHPVAPKYLIRN